MQKPDLKSLQTMEGKTIEYGGKKYVLTTKGPMNTKPAPGMFPQQVAPAAPTAPIQYVPVTGSVTYPMPTPQFDLNPTIKFVSNGKGGLAVEITPHPTFKN